jgi:hypothetical protein
MWVLALLLVTCQAVAHVVDRLLTAYLRGAATAGRAVLRIGGRVIAALGPLGRALRARLTPAVRVLRRVWEEVGHRLLRRMLRPLGRVGRRLAALPARVLGRLAGPAWRLLALPAQLTRPLAPWWRSLVRATSRRAEQLHLAARTVSEAVSGAVRAARLMPGPRR